jgi:superfamily II DNA or RNA helicase
MKIEFDNVTSKVTVENKADKEAFDAIKTSMGVMAPGAEYTKAFRLYKKTKGKHGWNGKVNVLTAAGNFPTGLLPEVMGRLWGTYKLLPTLIDNRPTLKPIRVGNSPQPLEMRPYQEEALQACATSRFQSLPWYRGIIEVATGGGKTEIAIELFRRNPRPTIFLVHRKTLARQTAERFERYFKTPVGRMFDGVFQPDFQGITVATIQTICTHIERSETQHILEGAEQVFYDEAHLIAAKMETGNQFIKVSNSLKKAHFRWGLTATPFLRDTYSNLLLEGVCGSVLYAETSKDLIDKGYLTPARIFVDKAIYVPKCPKPWPECYDTGIVLNKGRNEQIRDWFMSVPKPCFVLTMQVAHAKILLRQMNGMSVAYLDGKSTNEERYQVMKDLASGALEGVICTTIFDEGVDVPELQSVILAGGGKSTIKTIQRVGRALRLSDKKTEATIVDFMDTSCHHLKKHSEARIKTYEKRGFTVEQY